MTSSRNYPLLLVSQFLGALGDNVILMVILGQLTVKFKAGEITEQYLQSANAIYTSLLFIPYFLLGPLAGYLNDRYAKTRWLFGGNLTKLAGTLLATAGITMGHDWQGIGYLIVGIGACFYSPAKYGILPEILPTERLVKANGTVEMLTLVAILLGNVLGAKLIDHLPVLTCYGILIGIYASSAVLNLFMSHTPFDGSVRLSRSLAEFGLNFRDLLTHARLSRILLGTTLFWVSGAVLKMNLQPFGLKVLQLENNLQIALLGLWLAVGIMVGSVAAGHLHRTGDLRRTRPYGWALAAFIALLSFLATQSLVIPVLIVAGLSAGLFLIPLNASLQAESDPAKLGKTIAAQNFAENLVMSIGGVVVLLASQRGATASQVFLGLAVFTLLAVTLLKIPARPAAPAIS